MNQNYRLAWQRFKNIALPYWGSNVKTKALIFLGILLALMLAVNGLNVLINFVGGDFMTALSGKDVPKFYHQLLIYGAVFVVGTPIVVFYSWMQDKLGLHWRNWLTKHFLDKYFHNRSYYKVNSNSAIDNPDERISQDISAFTRGALNYLLIVLSSIITLFSFTAILWSISTSLVLVLIVYALLGTAATILFGKRLIGLNFNQLRREADFRFSLIHVRNNVESIAFYQGEEKESRSVKQRLDDALANFNVLIGWQRNLGFLTTGYNYFVVIIPSLVIAPLYFAGKVKFGVITQADMAFTQVLAALSIFVTQFSDLTEFIAVINRLGAFTEALDGGKPAADASGTIDSAIADQVKLEQVSLLTPNAERLLAKELSLAVEKGKGLLIVGPSGAGKSSILRAIAGLWDTGSGQITRPDLSEMLFLPQRPYMILGSLRSQILYPSSISATDSELYELLAKVNLADLPAKVGGLDVELDWADVLSLGEQQRLVFARLLMTRPNYAVLDEATSALDEANEERLYHLLAGTATTFVSVGHRSSLLRYHERVLELTGNGQWRLLSTHEYNRSPVPTFVDASEAA